MGRQRDDVVRVGVVEADAAGGEAVHPGRGIPGVPVGAERVGPQRVDRDQEDAQSFRAALAAGNASAGDRPRKQEQDGERRGPRPPAHLRREAPSCS